MINEKKIAEMVSTAEKLGWEVKEENCAPGKKMFVLSKCSPAGQDFFVDTECLINGNVDDMLKDIIRQAERFDPSSEAMTWLDCNGHGINGAPYEMCDVYEDMVTCQEALQELADELNKLL